MATAKFVAAPLTALALLLAGCAGGGQVVAADSQGRNTASPTPSASEQLAGDSEGEKNEAPQASGPGEYQFDYMGAVGILTVPTSESDPAVAELEAYRKLSGSDGVGYIKVHIDNTNGTENINMYQIVVVANNGVQMEFESVDDAVRIWQGRLDSDDGQGYNQGIDLSNKNQIYFRPGSTGTAILINPEPVSTVTRLYVYPSGGMDQVEAYRAN